MKLTSFRYCMLIGAAALVGLALFHFFKYVAVSAALDNTGLAPELKALRLAFACQSLLIGLLYALVAWKPHAMSRAVILILGLLQLVEAVLQFSLAGSSIVAVLLVVAALFVLIGSLLWPKRLPQPTTLTVTGLIK